VLTFTFQDCFFADNRYCRPADLDRVFIEVNVNMDATGQMLKKTPRKYMSNSANSTNSIARFELLEALVRIARLKYMKSTNVKLQKVSAAAAFLALMQKNVLPYAKVIDGDTFRTNCLYRKDVEMAFDVYLPGLHLVFNHYACCRRFGKNGKVNSKSRHYMDGNQALEVIEHGGLLDKCMNRKQFHLAFISCKIVVVDELHGVSSQWLTFLDFLELLVRIAYIRVPINIQHKNDIYNTNRLHVTVQKFLASIKDCNSTLSSRLHLVIQDIQEKSTTTSNGTKLDNITRTWNRRALRYDLK